MKTSKDEKIQVLLSSTDHHKLKGIIIQDALKNGKLVTVSAYVREVLLRHIREKEGEQISFTNETIKEIIKETKSKTENDRKE